MSKRSHIKKFGGWVVIAVSILAAVPSFAANENGVSEDGNGFVQVQGKQHRGGWALPLGLILLGGYASVTLVMIAGLAGVASRPAPQIELSPRLPEEFNDQFDSREEVGVN